MNNDWLPQDTTTHQDHVIAHVVGTGVLGYFILDEALYLLLDMGFIWTIFIDGEMGLLSQGLVIADLQTDEETKQQLLADIDLLQKSGRDAAGLARIASSPVECEISEVSFFSNGERRRLVVTGEGASLAIEMSLSDGEIEVYAL